MPDRERPGTEGPDAAPGPGPEGVGQGPEGTGPEPEAARPRERLRWFGHHSRVSAALVALLCMLLGVAIATQVRDTNSGDALDSARPADLLVVLDNLHRREASLQQEIAGLEGSLQSMESAGSDSREALAQSQQRLDTLRILVGVAPAQGPGVTVTVTDPAAGVGPSAMLDLLQELRAAGAEAVQFAGAGGSPQVRVGTATAITGGAGAVSVDGTALRAPYTVTAIGDGPTIAAALNIPGGVQDTVRRAGGEVTVQTSDHVEITAVRAPEPPHYARPGD